MSGQSGHDSADLPPAGEPDRALFDAAARLVPGVAEDAITVVRPDLLKIEATDGAMALRRWPASATEERVKFVHALMARLGETGEAPLVVAPFLSGQKEQPETFATFDGRYFDVRPWIRGAPFSRPPRVLNEDGTTFHLPGTLSVDDMALIGEAIGVVHEASRHGKPALTGPTAPVDRFCKATEAIFREQRQRLRRIATEHPHIQHWLRASEAVLGPALDDLRSARFLRTRQPPACHLDLWPGHLISLRQEDSAAIGLIDFKNAAITSPVLDLAQAASRLRPWSQDTPDALIGGYTARASLTPEERRSLSAVTALTLIVDTGTYLERAWLGDEPGDTAQAAAIRKASAQGVGSLERLITVMNRDRRGPGAKKRVWQRRPVPGGRPKRGDGPTRRD